MTRRERLEARAERRREWAAKRAAKSDALLQRNKPYEGDHAFNTQPGHIPERARAITRSENAYAHTNMARHHESKASGIELQLERSIFSDDADAVEKLEERIRAINDQCALMKRANAAYKKAKGAPGWASSLGTYGPEIEAAANRLFAIASYHKLPFPAYALSNARANARRLSKRVAEIQSRQQRTQKAEESGGVVVVVDGGYCSITFAEKPSRCILNALRAAGLYWGGGSWSGHYDRLPTTSPSSFGPDVTLWESMMSQLHTSKSEVK